MVELFQTLWQLVTVLWTLLVQVLHLILVWALLLAWLAWALFAVNWRKAWPTLAAGAWVPVVLLGVLAALVWANLEPYPAFAFAPPFWSHLAAVTLVAAATLFLGWLQGVLGWCPPEIDLEPPAAAHDHGHAH